MEHIERAGIHSGDSACVIPPVSIPAKHLATIEDYTRRIAIALKVVGLMNIQYAIERDVVFVLEANPRASRTVPLVSKVCNIPMAKLATRVMLGAKLGELGLARRVVPHFGVKESVFPFAMFPEVDPVLGPEMRSTGEVLGLAQDFGTAFAKSQEAAGQRLPTEGTVLITVADAEKEQAVLVARRFRELGFRVLATGGTHAFFAGKGVETSRVAKLHEERPDIVDAITNGEIQLVVNTPTGQRGKREDAYIRQSAIKYRIPYITTIAGALAAVEGIAAIRAKKAGVRSLQEYHAAIS
jgi:carbamoyl-phosphate synthase large subunit